MTQAKYVELSVAQRTEVWRRWKAGESLHRIGRALARDTAKEDLQRAGFSSTRMQSSGFGPISVLR
jgi:hypothetical protein